MSAKLDEFPSLPFQDIKEKPKRHGRTDGRTERRTDNMKTVYPPPPTNIVCGEYNNPTLYTYLTQKTVASLYITDFLPCTISVTVTLPHSLHRGQVNNSTLYTYLTQKTVASMYITDFLPCTITVRVTLTSLHIGLDQELTP